MIDERIEKKYHTGSDASQYKKAAIGVIAQQGTYGKWTTVVQRYSKSVYHKRGNNERKKQRGSIDADEKKSGHLLCTRNAIQRRG